MHQSSRGADISLSSNGCNKWEVLDFGDIEKSLAARLSDDDVHINASQTQEDKVKWLCKY
jgi:hypothetical protein